MKKFNNFNESNIQDNDKGKCYIFVQGNDINIEHYYELVRKSKNDEIILYPEHSMRFIDIVEYRPYVKSIVTENPYLISCYDKRNVFILVDDEWVNPTIQTYGASVSYITSDLLNYTNTIPMMVYGGSSFKEKIKKLKNYDNEI